LFPGYCISAFGQPEFSLTLNAPHVFELLRFGRQDAVIEEEEIQRLRAMSELPGIEPWQGIPTGTRIIVKDGPLRGAYGYLKSRKGDFEVVIEVQFLGTVKPVAIDGWCIEKA
jgi:transcription antitermination factor NusG